MKCLVGLLSALILCGCSVSAQEQPDRISITAVNPSAAPPRVRFYSALELSTMCLVQHGHLVWVNRDIPSRSGLNGTLDSLAAGPTAAEAKRGIRSALPASTTRLVAVVHGNIASIAVPRGFGNLAADEQILAVAQLTFTVTTFPGVEALQLTSNGHDVSMPVSNGGHGGLIAGPVLRSNYLLVAPLPTH